MKMFAISIQRQINSGMYFAAAGDGRRLMLMIAAPNDRSRCG